MLPFTNLHESLLPPARAQAVRPQGSGRTPCAFSAARPAVSWPDVAWSTSFRSVEVSPTIPVRMPSLHPTVAPLGHERLIAIRYVLDGEVVVKGGATGREYHFAAGQARDIPLADARLLVSEGDFAFSGGR